MIRINNIILQAVWSTDLTHTEKMCAAGCVDNIIQALYYVLDWTHVRCSLIAYISSDNIDNAFFTYLAPLWHHRNNIWNNNMLYIWCTVKLFWCKILFILSHTISSVITKANSELLVQCAWYIEITFTCWQNGTVKAIKNVLKRFKTFSRTF